MAFDAAQILRQTYAAGAEAAKMRELAEPARTQAPAVQRGELMGTAFTVEADPMAELMDSMEELSFQFEEKEAKRVGERKMGEMQGPRTALLKAVESESAHPAASAVALWLVAKRLFRSTVALERT